MVGWHHRLSGHEFQQAPGDGERQESLVCCSPWVAMSQTQLSDWTELKAVTPIPPSCASLSKFHLTSLSFIQCPYLQNGGHNSYLSGLQRSIRLMSVKVVLEKTLENLLDCKEIKPVNYKGKQPWIFIGRTVAEAEASILWPPDTKGQLIRNDPDAGKDWRQKEKRVAEDEMIR